MRVNRANQLLDGALEAERQRCFRDQFRRARPDHVHAEHLVVLLLGDDLHEAFGLSGDARAAEHDELERADADVEPALPGLRFRQSDAADFRIAVSAARHLFVVDRTELVAGDALGERDAFGRREMRELLMPRLLERDHVANRRDARHVGAELVVDPHVAAIELDAQLFGPESARHRSAPRGDEQVLGVELLRFAIGRLRGIEFDVNAVRTRLRARHLRAGEDLDALLLERAFEFSGDGFVLDRHQPRQQLDDRDVTAEAAEDRREFDADRAAAHDGDRLRDRLHVDRFVTRDDPLAIDLDARHAARLRAGGDDDLLARGKRLLVAFGDLHRALAGDAPRSFDPVDLVLLEQELDAAGQSLDDLVLAGLYLVHVEGNGGLPEREAPFLPVLRDLERVRVLEQRLGRDAAPVQARAAEDGRAFDHGRLEADLRGADGGHVAARPRADDDNVVLVSH